MRRGPDVGRGPGRVVRRPPGPGVPGSGRLAGPPDRFVVGRGPQDLAFDGANIWVGNNGSNTVTKLARNGASLGTFTVGRGPLGVAFDGTNIWVANNQDGTVSKL